mmetsp:Transcript_53713/g.150049  ORF Transcript_53713/g.150049 Transcript_53713/m.150049 type:complete len:452 (-) Transcript_53713:3380-4735(-)
MSSSAERNLHAELRQENVARLRVLLPRVVGPERPPRRLPHPLPMQGHAGEDRRLDVRDQRGAAVDGRAAYLEAVRERLRVHAVGHVDDEVERAALQQGQHIRLPLHARLEREHARLNPVVLEGLVSALCRVQLETHGHEQIGDLQELLLLLVRTDGHQHVLSRNLETSSDHRLQEGLVLVHPEARHLAGRLHLHAESRVRILQASKRKHGRLACDVFHIDRLHGLRVHGHAEEHPRRELDEVDVVCLRNEGHRSGSAQVALDHLDIILFADELDVERTRDIQLPAEFLPDLLNAALCLHKKLLRWKQQRSVPTVHASVLDVLRDGIVQHHSVLSHGVELDLLGPRDVLRHHHGVLAAHNGRGPKKPLQFARRVHHSHGGSAEHVRWTHQHGKADAIAKKEGLLHGRELGPLWLVYAESVTELTELEPVLASIDRINRCSQDLDAGLMQPHC